MSTFQVGCIFGSLFTFPLVERFGRRKGMILASMVFCLGAGIMVKMRSLVVCANIGLTSIPNRLVLQEDCPLFMLAEL